MLVGVRGLAAFFAIWALLAPMESRAANWRTVLDRATAVVSDTQKFRSDTCARVIHAIIDPFVSTPAFPALAEGALGRDTPNDVALGFFNLRVLLKRRLDGFSSPDGACLDAARRAFRYSRFAEDYLIEHLETRQARAGAPRGLFMGGLPHTTVSRGDANRVELRAGDVIMMRATSFASAMIARIGAEEGDFSHLAMVSEDSAGRLFVVESRVETGASVKPLAEYLVNIEERSVLFRHRDPALARRAGRAIHDIVAGAIAAGRPIAYDLSLDLDDHKRVFCAELVHMAFEAASNGAVQIPRHASRIKRFARSTFMRDFGVSITKTFLPSDMELDPRFDVVAEHRNIPLLRDIRLRNAAVASLYRWLDAGYSFRPEAMSEAVGPTLARLQFGAAPVADVPRARLALFVKLRTAIKMLEDDLRSRDRRWRAERGRAMAFRELLSELEAMRREDCARFLARRAIPDEASVFHLHDLLNVANGDCRAVR